MQSRREKQSEEKSKIRTNYKEREKREIRLKIVSVWHSMIELPGL